MYFHGGTYTELALMTTRGMKNEKICSDTYRIDNDLQRWRWACDHEQSGTVNHRERENLMCV